VGFFRALFGPPDIDALKASQNVGGLIGAASHKDALVRDKAVEALVSLRPAATDALLKQLSSVRESDRQIAARVLGQLGWQPNGADERVAFLIAGGEWGDIDMAVFCQVSKAVPPHRHHEFFSVPALSGLFVLQVRLVGDTAF
jgi:hypothetical protein